MKHAQRTEKYIRLIFNSYISDGNFFKSPCALQTRTSFFLEIFKAKRGCALCTNVHYTTLNTVIIKNKKRRYQIECARHIYGITFIRYKCTPKIERLEYIFSFNFLIAIEIIYTNFDHFVNLLSVIKEYKEIFVAVIIYLYTCNLKEK